MPGGGEPGPLTPGPLTGRGDDDDFGADSAGGGTPGGGEPGPLTCRGGLVGFACG
jgi:hypothetical protein